MTVKLLISADYRGQPVRLPPAEPEEQLHRLLGLYPLADHLMRLQPAARRPTAIQAIVLLLQQNKVPALAVAAAAALRNLAQVRSKLLHLGSTPTVLSHRAELPSAKVKSPSFKGHL